MLHLSPILKQNLAQMHRSFKLGSSALNMHKNEHLLSSSVMNCGCKTHETDPEGILSTMNPAHSHQSCFCKIHLNSPVMQEQEFGFVEHVHIEFFVGLSFFFGDFLFTVCSSVVNLGQQVPCPAAGIVSFQYL